MYCGDWFNVCFSMLIHNNAGRIFNVRFSQIFFGDEMCLVSLKRSDLNGDLFHPLNTDGYFISLYLRVSA